MRYAKAWLTMLSAAAAAAAGCRVPALTFPAEPCMKADSMIGYDTDADGRADFFFCRAADGRYSQIGYDRDGDARPDSLIDLDAADPRQCRHLVLILDGIPYEAMREFHQAGHLREFTAPAVVIPPYPAMTDLALEDALGYMPAQAVEAKFFSRSRRRVVGGARDYLAGRNEPFAHLINYRVSPIYDAFAYLWPKPVFEKELNDIMRRWRQRGEVEMVAYSVASAAMGTRMGKEGHLYTLRRCEQLIHQVIFETGGLAKITVFSDHGQTGVPARNARLDQYLRQKGWRLSDRIVADRDVALIEFGLVTYAGLSTRRPRELVDDLMGCEAVDLCSYLDGDAVIVRGKDSAAEIRSPDNGKTFVYKALRGDPLRLGPLVGPGGQVDGRELLARGVEGRHPYPDALYRLWRAHTTLVENPPDVMVSLHSQWYAGKDSFAGLVDIKSTHGGLSWEGSASFLMSTAAPIPGPLRSGDVPRVMERIFGRPFRYCR